MLNRSVRRLLSLGGAAMLVVGLIATAATASPRPPATLYVGAGHSSSGHRSGCNHAGFSTISAAVVAARSGATIIVCPGTYVEDVTVEKPLTIEGRSATVAPAVGDSSPLTPLTGGNNGFTVLSPWVTVSGFTVEGASSDG